VVEGFASAPRGFDKDPKIITQLKLADKLGERPRSQRHLDRILLGANRINGARHSIAH
jgi:hypothetical protein